MPELPEVETVRAGLEPVLRGRRFVRVEQRRKDLRFPLPERFAERLTGRKVERLDRRAKYILVHLDGREVLAMHLGMTGRFSVMLPGAARTPSPRLRHAEGVPPARREGHGGAVPPARGDGQTLAAAIVAAPHPHPHPHPNPLPTEEWGEGIQLGDYTYDHGADAKHDHLVFTMSGGAIVTYNDARRFGYMALVPERELDTHEFFAGLGVEPLGDDLTPEYLARRAAAKKVDLKALLMDQRVIAGLGNIYVCEALFRAGLSPFRPAARLATKTGKPAPTAERLVLHIKAVLADAIRAGGSTLRDFKQADGSVGAFQNEFRVYGREGEPCSRPRCRGRVRRKTQGGRSTFYCPVCQR
jgi:formamidopyrimidine-DNA glycosylase